MQAAPAFVYQAARRLSGAIARLYFRRIDLRHRERVPRSGPLLVVANHPASITDVLVLGAALPRQLHFLAMAPIFHPWPVGVALRLGGALPVYRRVDDPAETHRNEETFREVQALLAGGGAVLIFPEGTSETDRSIVRIKTGAARLALSYAGTDPLVLVPVGLHFAERTGFWTDVTVSVGRPVDLEPFRAAAARDPVEAVRQLTVAIQRALERLILHLDQAGRRALVEAIQQLYADEALAGAPGAHPLAVARGMAECVEHFARHDQARLLRGWRRIERYRRRLEALGIHDRALREMLPRPGRMRERIRLLLLGLLGIVPAALGGILHYLPYRLCGTIARRLTSDPARLAIHRIGLGLVLFPANYALLAALLHEGFGWGTRRIALAALLVVPLGVHAVIYFRWLHHQRERIRLIVLRASHLRGVARLRRERRALIRLFEDAWRDYCAEREEETAGETAAT